MPVFVLFLKARLENIARIELPEDYHYDVTLKNSSSDDTRDVMISAEENVPLSNGRSSANFVMKWDKGSKVVFSFIETSITVMHLKNVTKEIGSDDSEIFVPVMAFECRGAEPIAFRPGSGFWIESVGGKIVEDVDLTDLDWCDFDESENVSIGVYELESKFEVHRK